MLNVDKTPFSYVSPGKCTFDLTGSATVPIKGIDDKRQITATFTVFVSDSFLSIFNSSIMVKPSVVYQNTISLIALMLHHLQIIGPILKSVSACFRKLYFPTQRNNTLQGSR